MPPKFQRPHLALIIGANLVAIPAISRPVLAADASPWDGNQRAAVRLIAGAPRVEGAAAIHRAGIEIRLAPGWKTYWRYPGDSGIPPRFDFSSSNNVKTVTVRYPAPQRLTDVGGTSIGYKQDVIFPLEVVPENAGKPVTLSLRIDYAVCEKLCVPADGTAELTLTGKGGERDVKLGQSEALVPRPTTLGGDGSLAIRAAKREGKRVIVDVAAPGGAPVELFAEGPTPDWALPVPAAAAGAPAGQQRFAFELDGLPPNATADGATLTLTAVAGEQAIEAAFRLE
jgi:DsbC/DsbD-like thiol-disulfide interchange protein